MKKKIAVLFCGLCNINPKNIDGIFSAFDKISSDYDVTVDYYMHLWNDENMFPENFDGKRVHGRPDQSYYEYLPTEDKSLHANVIDNINPKMIVYSNYSDTINNSFYDGTPSYISFVNTLGQFYAFDKLLNSANYDDYDLIIRWRYDLLVNHHDFSLNMSNALNSLSPNVKYFASKDTHIIGGGHGKYGNNDRWFGITPNLIQDFNSLHKKMYVETKKESHMGDYTYVEEAFLNIITAANPNRVSVQFIERVIRKNMLICENYSSMSKDEQDSQLNGISIWVGPEHANNGYTPD